MCTVWWLQTLEIEINLVIFFLFESQKVLVDLLIHFNCCIILLYYVILLYYIILVPYYIILFFSYYIISYCIILDFILTVTEKNYVDALQMIVEKFIKHLEPGVLNPDQMSTIFMNIQVWLIIFTARISLVCVWLWFIITTWKPFDDRHIEIMKIKHCH